MDLWAALSLFKKPLFIIDLGCVDLSCSRAMTHPTQHPSGPGTSSNLSSTQLLTLGKALVFVSLGDRQRKTALQPEKFSTFMLSLDWSLHHVLFLPCLSCWSCSSMDLDMFSSIFLSTHIFPQVQCPPRVFLSCCPLSLLLFISHNIQLSGFKNDFPSFYTEDGDHVVFLFLSTLLLEINWDLKSIVLIVYSCKVWCMF